MGRASRTRRETVQEKLIAALGQLDAARRRALADGLDAWLEAAGLGETPATMFFEGKGRGRS